MRLFWNRSENLDENIDDTPEHWGELVCWLRRHWKTNTIIEACYWYQDYRGDSRVAPISISAIT